MSSGGEGENKDAVDGVCIACPPPFAALEGSDLTPTAFRDANGTMAELSPVVDQKAGAPHRGRATAS
eukprot:CAMPEP_0115866232 /NCGR_PEP_ID=MMETSP0287-20121206/20142_1 /TAXON_ID=412157 /ORGANISM="Chrysochromulina rotalis, Strain UIO044" /LENGTH=66 /DNA_ID=CAMNT_0003320791 /DNA_START=764 /DNA_END=965 /DNA_ORIENTATION=+